MPPSPGPLGGKAHAKSEKTRAREKPASRYFLRSIILFFIGDVVVVLSLTVGLPLNQPLIRFSLIGLIIGIAMLVFGYFLSPKDGSL